MDEKTRVCFFCEKAVAEVRSNYELISKSGLFPIIWNFKTQMNVGGDDLNRADSA